MRLGEVVIFVSFSLVCVFVCIISLFLLQVLLRCILETSHTCFLTSIVCSESDRLLDTHRDRIYQGSSTFWSAIFLQAVLFFRSASSRQVQRCVRFYYHIPQL